MASLLRRWSPCSQSCSCSPVASWLAHRHLGFLPNAQGAAGRAGRRGRHGRRAGPAARHARAAPARTPLLLYPPLVLALSPRAASSRPRASGGEPARLHVRPARAGRATARAWYLDADPMEQVDGALVEFVAAARRAHRARPGLRPGRLHQALAAVASGRAASTSSPEYVERARALGVESGPLRRAHGCRYEDGRFDTVDDAGGARAPGGPAGAAPQRLARVARRGVLVKTSRLGPRTSTRCRSSSATCLTPTTATGSRSSRSTRSCDGCSAAAVVEQAAPVDELVLGLHASASAAAAVPRASGAPGAARPRFYSRLLGRAPV